MSPELEENFLHLERSRKRLNQHRRADGAVRHTNVGLRKAENVVPEARLKVMLHLGKIEVRTGAASDEFLRIVEEVKSKVENRCGHGLVVNRYAGFVQMPSSRTVREDWKRNLLMVLIVEKHKYVLDTPCPDGPSREDSDPTYAYLKWKESDKITHCYMMVSVPKNLQL